MLALVKTGPGGGLDLRDVPMPEVGINDILIRVRKTGICGTDLHIESWDAWAARTIKPPLVVGHEFVGEIVEVGANVADFGPGDLVSGEGHVVCGRCRHCLAGRRHLCANTIGLGVGRDGAFAEYVSLPMTNVWHHWPGVDEEVAAIFDPSGNATALRSAIRAMAHGGGIAILGIPTEEISLDVNAIVFKMLTLRGIYGREMYETWYKMTVMLQSGLDITPAITHRFGFREFEAAFAAARAGDSG